MPLGLQMSHSTSSKCEREPICRRVLKRAIQEVNDVNMSRGRADDSQMEGFGAKKGPLTTKHDARPAIELFDYSKTEE